MGTLFLSFSSMSCAAAKDEKGPADNDLVYLKAAGATASGFDESTDWAPRPDPMAVIDGNDQTRWASAYHEGEWIYIDFAKPKTISRLVIKWESAYAVDYEILTSDDAKDWMRLVLEEGKTGGVHNISFEPVTTRYVKILGLKRVNPEWGISIWEIEPYGPKDKNPEDRKIGEVFEKKEAELEKKRDAIKISPGEIVASPGPIKPDEFQRGVNYTSWGKGELAGEISDFSIIYISELGVGHIALMAVYYQDDAESKTMSAAEKTVSDESLGHAINVIHHLGMKVMLKPHVDLIDEDARSNIIPSDEWFASYKEFITHYAQLAAKYNVEIFCIGTELSNTTTSRWKDKWLDIINAVREIYKGPITYAANWDEYDTVSFWPEVDYIGMDAYFPLTKKNNPPLEELIAAWNKHADTLKKWLEDNNLTKQVIFTEIGYDTVEGSNRQPWRILPTLAKNIESQEEQAHCLESLLEVMSKRSWFKGLYWWNYFPRPDIGPLGYTLRGKLGEKVLSGWYKKLK